MTYDPITIQSHFINFWKHLYLV